MERLKGYQKKYLRVLAHAMKPVVLIGLKGITATVLDAVAEALDRHELIKVKFNEFKEKDQKKALTAAIEEGTASELVGMIGHMVIIYRRQKDPEKRKITLPEK